MSGARLARAGCRAVRDSALVAWYRSLSAPRAGGAYDSHHRTAGIADRPRRRGCRVAARGARAAAGGAGDRVPQRRISRRVPAHGGCVPSGPPTIGLCRAQNVLIEYRLAEGQNDRLPTMEPIWFIVK